MEFKLGTKLEAKAEDEDTNRATSSHVNEKRLCSSDQAKLAEELGDFFTLKFN